MIKLRKYFRGHNSIYVHGTAKGKDVTLYSTPDRPEWVREDIVLPKPLVLHRQEWYNVHTKEVMAVTLNLSEIDEDGTIRYSDWYNGCTINPKDCMDDPPPGVETNPGPFFCLVINGTEYWYEEIEKDFPRVQSLIGDYNTELYLKAMDEQGTA